jgi:DNA-binding transcriptional MerR regulator
VSDGPTPTRPAKSAVAFRTIGEVADDLDLPPYILRFWESKFPQLKPLKRGGGRRYYRPEDIALLRRIRQCLYHDGYTIRGAQKLLDGPAPAGDVPTLDSAAANPRQPQQRPRRSNAGEPHASAAALEEIRRELREARALVEELLRPGKGGGGSGGGRDDERG